MFIVISTLVIIFVVLVINEFLWREEVLSGEAARKLVHILIGAWAAFWPLYMTWSEVQIIGAIAVAAFVFMRFTPFFKSVFDVERRSWGDIGGPAAIVILATLEPSEWVFVAAILHIALADGFAALLGSKYGKKSQYKVIGNTKSLVGTAVFWLISFAILVTGAAFAETGLSGLSVSLLAWTSAGAAYLENISPFGLDNLTVPLLIVLILEPLQFVF